MLLPAPPAWPLFKVVFFTCRIADRLPVPHHCSIYTDPCFFLARFANLLNEQYYYPPVSPVCVRVCVCVCVCLHMCVPVYVSVWVCLCYSIDVWRNCGAGSSYNINNITNFESADSSALDHLLSKRACVIIVMVVLVAVVQTARPVWLVASFSHHLALLL